MGLDMMIPEAVIAEYGLKLLDPDHIGGFDIAEGGNPQTDG
jgi:hypothetical protein